MYHVIASPPSSAPYPDLYLSPELFRAHVQYLHSHGYHAVTLEQVWRYWHGQLRLPKHPIVLSFDDGYLSQYTVAAKLLAVYHWPGVLNLVVKHLHLGSYGLSRGRVDKMIAEGWEIDSHTINHVDLTTLDATGLAKEVRGSRLVLRRLFHQPIDFFCYPAGAYNAGAIAAVRNADYLAATTTNPGLATPSQDPYELSRIRISGNETAAQLSASLRPRIG
jgi:peptidoglycan/xylan/chitin deacetylase (PgdA/CDA1 family)